MEEEKQKPKRKAITDITYCTCETCENKCWRHKSNFNFDEECLYWITNECIEKE